LSLPTSSLLCAAILYGTPASDEPVVRWVERPSTAAAPPAHPFQITLAPARPGPAEPIQLHAATPIDIEVEDADIRSVLRLFSTTSGLNFVVPDTVQSKVTAQLTNVPWDMALAAILSAEGLQGVPYASDVVLIQPLSEP